MRRRKRLPIAVAMLTVGLAVPLVTGVANAAPPPGSAGPSTPAAPPLGGRASPLHGVALAVQAKGLASMSNFGGVALVDGGTKVAVYLTRGLSIASEHAASQALAGALGSTPAADVVYYPAVISAADSAKLVSSIVAQRDALASSGIDVVYGMPMLSDSGRIHLGVDGPITPTVTSTLDSDFGANNIVIEQGTAPIPHDRDDDVPPFWGGDGLDDGGHGCTGGFPAYNGNGTQYMITAAHCYPRLDTITNDYGSTTIGEVTQRDLDNPGLDAELINLSTTGGGQGIIYTCGSTNACDAYTDGSSSVVPGDSICTSGQPSGEICGETVTSLNNFYYNNLTGTTVTDLDAATNSPWTLAIQDGDSGGPAYYYVNESGTWQEEAAGILSAGDGNSWACDGDSQGCNDQVWFTDITPILNTWGLAVDTYP